MSFVKKKKQELITEQKKMQLDGWRDKPLHKQCPLRTAGDGYKLDISRQRQKTSSWQLKIRLATKAYRVTILKQQGSKKCRMCNESDETVMHILSKCSKQYKKRHDKVATMVHWELCSKYGFDPAKHW